MPDELNADFDDIDAGGEGVKSPSGENPTTVMPGGDPAAVESGTSEVGQVQSPDLELPMDFDDIDAPSKYERIDPVEDPIGWFNSLDMDWKKAQESGAETLGSVASLFHPVPGIHKGSPYANEKFRLFPAADDLLALLSETLYVGPREAIGEALDTDVPVLKELGEGIGIMTGFQTERDEHGKIDVNKSVWDKVLGAPSRIANESAGRSTMHTNTPLRDAMYKGIARRYNFMDKEVRRNWEKLIEEDPVGVFTDVLMLGWGGTGTYFAGLKLYRKLDKLTGKTRMAEKFLHESMNLKLGKYAYTTKFGMWDGLDLGMLPLLGVGKTTRMLFDGMMKRRSSSVEKMTEGRKALYYQNPEIEELERFPVEVKDPDGGGGSGGSPANDQEMEYDRIIREHDEAEGGDAFAELDEGRQAEVDAKQAETDAAQQAQEGWTQYGELTDEQFDDFSDLEGVQGNFKRIIVDPPGDQPGVMKQAGADEFAIGRGSSQYVNSYQELVDMMSGLDAPGVGDAKRIESYFTEEGWAQFGQALFDKAQELGLNPQVIEETAIGPIQYLDRNQVIKDVTDLPVDEHMTPDKRMLYAERDVMQGEAALLSTENELKAMESPDYDAGDFDLEARRKGYERSRESGTKNLEEARQRRDEAKRALDEHRAGQDLEGVQKGVEESMMSLEEVVDATSKELNNLSDEMAYYADPRKFLDSAQDAFARFSDSHFRIFDDVLNRSVDNLKAQGAWDDGVVVPGENVRRYIMTLEEERYIPLWLTIGRPATDFRDMPFDMSADIRNQLVEHISENRNKPRSEDYGVSLSEALRNLPDDASELMRDRMKKRLTQERNLWRNSNEIGVYEGLLEAMNLDLVDAVRRAEGEDGVMAQTLEGAASMHGIVEAKMKTQFGQFLQTELGGGQIDPSRYHKVIDNLFTPDITRADVDDVLMLIGGTNSEAGKRLQSIFGQKMIEHLTRVNSGKKSSGTMADLIANADKADVVEALLPENMIEGLDRIDQLLEQVKLASERKGGGPVTVEELPNISGGLGDADAKAVEEGGKGGPLNTYSPDRQKLMDEGIFDENGQWTPEAEQRAADGEVIPPPLPPSWNDAMKQNPMGSKETTADVYKALRAEYEAKYGERAKAYYEAEGYDPPREEGPARYGPADPTDRGEGLPGDADRDYRGRRRDERVAGEDSDAVSPREKRRMLYDTLRHFGYASVGGGITGWQTQNLMLSAATFGAIMGAPHIYRKYSALMDDTAAGKGLMVDYVLEVLNDANQRKMRTVLRGAREEQEGIKHGGPMRLLPGTERRLQRGGLQVQY